MEISDTSKTTTLKTMTEIRPNSQENQLLSNNQPHEQPPHKYPKLQAKPVPVQLKMKKPIPIAVLPKPCAKIESKFNPNIKTNNTIKLKHEIGLSKKWVLPPRPRPGRKPVNNEEIDEEAKKQHLKDLHKGVREMNVKDPIKPKEKIEKKEHKIIAKEEKLDKIEIGEVPSSLMTTKESPELSNLKMEYLSKLKEQLLINNYIGAINNQIKQLDFIKNGYMTLDTLNQLNLNKPDTSSSTMPNANITPELDSTIPRKNFNDLETINNLNDLDVFLKYLNKSSNLINRVTKTYNSNENVNEQILKYLQLRANYKLMEKRQKKLSKAKTELQNERNSTTLSNDYLNLSNDKSCPICSKTSPCFCLDIDRKFNENNWNESYR